MVDATYIDNNRVQVINNDDISFDTERPSVALFPDDERLVITGLSVQFPSPLQGTAYFRGVTGPGAVCEYWSTLVWQEWGPNESYHNELYFPGNPPASIPGPTTRNLPSTLLGTVAAESNYLDIRARINRTVTPDPFLGVQSPVSTFPYNEWINLSSGGSCPVEFHYPLMRHFDIRRSGNSIYLDRYQSCHNTNSRLAPGGYPQRNIAVNESGWNSFSKFKNSDGLGAGTFHPYSNQNLIYLMNSKGPTPTGFNRRPGSGSDECDFSTFKDMQSVYTVDLIITPGVYKEAA